MPGLYDQIESHIDNPEDKPSTNTTDLFHHKDLGVKEENETVHDPPPLLERLNKKFDDEVVGLTTMDIFKLKGAQKQIMLLMLRDSDAATLGISYEGLKEKLSQINADDLKAALEVLAQNGWIIVSGEAPKILYRVHMRRKKGSDLGLGIWGTLNKHLTRPAKPDQSNK